MIFAYTWKYISFFGSIMLYLGILNAILGRKIETVWRLMLFAAIVVSVIIVTFDLAAFSAFSSPTLYWLGLRRGDFVPNPEDPDSGNIESMDSPGGGRLFV